MIPIAQSHDVSQIERIRSIVEGCACVVIGSAPLQTKHADVAPNECVVAVNGGISSAPGLVDLWVLNSKQQDRPGDPNLKPLHKTMLLQGAERPATHVLLLRGPKVASETYTLDALDRMGCRYHTWSVLDKTTKRWFEGEQCARVKDSRPCSAGVLTVAMALWCGAAHVRMVGFSLLPGYHYLPTERPQSWWRDHVEADQRAIKALAKRYGDRLSGSLVETVAA